MLNHPKNEKRVSNKTKTFVYLGDMQIAFDDLINVVGILRAEDGGAMTDWGKIQCDYLDKGIPVLIRPATPDEKESMTIYLLRHHHNKSFRERCKNVEEI